MDQAKSTMKKIYEDLNSKKIDMYQWYLDFEKYAEANSLGGGPGGMMGGPIGMIGGGEAAPTLPMWESSKEDRRDDRP